MNKHRFHVPRAVVFAASLSALGAPSLVLLPGCWDSSPCDPGQIIVQNNCRTVPPDAGTTAAATSGSGATSGSAGSGGSGGAGGGMMTGGQPAADAFSYKLCATNADCGGHTPTCTKMAPPPSTTLYCTNSPCETGAADTCPLGGSCSDAFKSFGAPNFCAKD